jgi:hypothetical protein
MVRFIHALVLGMVLVWPAGVVRAAEPPALAKARALYNDADYEGAIDAASVARGMEGWSDAAALVIARSHLERYRQTANPADLTAGRQALQTIRVDVLSPRDQVDYVIGVGQALYLGEQYGAAAELFGTALARDSLLSERDRLMLLDWWATALDREAQSRPGEARPPVFERIVERMEEELRQDAGNPVASYWLAVGARGAGDIERAWDAAVAAWARSSLAPASAPKLRTDLDRLVTQALIPERSRARPVREQQDAIAMLQAEWDLVKQQWP